MNSHGPEIRFWSARHPHVEFAGRLIDKLGHVALSEYHRREMTTARVRESVRKFHKGIDNALDEAIERLNAL